MKNTRNVFKILLICNIYKLNVTANELEINVSSMTEYDITVKGHNVILDGVKHHAGHMSYGVMDILVSCCVFTYRFIGLLVWRQWSFIGNWRPSKCVLLIDWLIDWWWVTCLLFTCCAILCSCAFVTYSNKYCYCYLQLVASECFKQNHMRCLFVVSKRYAQTVLQENSSVKQKSTKWTVLH